MFCTSRVVTLETELSLVSLINGFLVGTNNVCPSVIRIANAAGQNKENTRFPSSCGFAVKIRKINEKKKRNSCTALFSLAAYHY